jgi:hypothetical protein
MACGHRHSPHQDSLIGRVVVIRARETREQADAHVSLPVTMSPVRLTLGAEEKVHLLCVVLLIRFFS